VLRIQRPQIELLRRSWDDVAGSFVSHTVGRYQHNPQGWSAIS